jgi:hypothetical protein
VPACTTGVLPDVGGNIRTLKNEVTIFMLLPFKVKGLALREMVGGG